jgi:RNA polymerase sigma-70 factor, ECF subfamily
MDQKLNYTEIYENFSPKISRYLNCNFSIEDSEDLLQDIFIKVYHSLPNFRGEASINTWIYQIATNSVIDRIKSNVHKFTKVQQELNTTTLHYNNSQFTTTFEKQVEKEEMNDCIRQFINELTEKNRVVFILSQYEDLSNKEIAEVLNISIGSVKIRLHRAKETLKASLSQNCHIYFDDCNEMSCEPVSSCKH